MTPANGHPLLNGRAGTPPGARSDGHPPGAPWSLPDAAGYLGICPRTLATLVADGTVRSILIKRRRLIPDAEVARVATQGTG